MLAAEVTTPVVSESSTVETSSVTSAAESSSVVEPTSSVVSAAESTPVAEPVVEAEPAVTESAVTEANTPVDEADVSGSTTESEVASESSASSETAVSSSEVVEPVIETKEGELSYKAVRDTEAAYYATRDVQLVLDLSGSMGEAQINQLNRMSNKIINSLNDNDRAAISIYNGDGIDFHVSFMENKVKALATQANFFKLYNDPDMIFYYSKIADTTYNPETGEEVKDFPEFETATSDYVYRQASEQTPLPSTDFVDEIYALDPNKSETLSIVFLTDAWFSHDNIGDDVRDLAKAPNFKSLIPVLMPESYAIDSKDNDYTNDPDFLSYKQFTEFGANPIVFEDYLNQTEGDPAVEAELLKRLDSSTTVVKFKELQIEVVADPGATVDSAVLVLPDGTERELEVVDNKVSYIFTPDAENETYKVRFKGSATLEDEVKEVTARVNVGTVELASETLTFKAVLKETKEVTTTKQTPFMVTYVDNPELEQGKTNVITPGVYGLMEVVTEEYYEDGVKVSEKVISETVTKEPIHEVVERGTKVAEVPVEPTKPTNPVEPTKPVDPANPGDPAKPSAPAKPAKSPSKPASKPADPVQAKLPQTGEVAGFGALGLASLATGLVTFFRRKNKK